MKFFTTNHPQTDGQTERINSLLEDYLRHYVNASQYNWVDLLDTTQFCYNLHKSSATKLSPFEVVTGQQPATPHEVVKSKSMGSSPAAYRFARNKQEPREAAQDNLANAVRMMKKYVDQHKRPLKFQEGNLVLLKLTQILKKFNKKKTHKVLVQRYEGPFEVVKRVEMVTYRLKLPEKLKIHLTFHVSYLKPFNSDEADPGRSTARRAPPLARKEFAGEIEQILSHETRG
ncbi:hypothetical protein Syun_003791 [Stephania yunnanensis]|uniref:Integrase catalytic domain-containing protein n=1 Tax=Stephania yunnanensis TaxID=152371 RepID=A0AAP0L4F5_9MAGN